MARKRGGGAGDGNMKTVMNWSIGLAGIALLGLIMLILFGNLSGNVGFTQDGITITITNETGAYVNISGYTLSGYNSTWSSMSVDAVWANAIPGAGVGTPYLIPSANYTLSSVGVLTNATQVDNSTEYDNANVSYNYLFSIDSGTVTSIIGNISAGLVTFFASTGTIFSILIVVVIILAISIIIWAVGRFGQQTEGTVNL